MFTQVVVKYKEIYNAFILNIKINKKMEKKNYYYWNASKTHFNFYAIRHAKK